MSKKKHPEHVNHERWLVSYADFITLLFAFFVVLFASGQNDKRKSIKLAQAMQSAFRFNGIFDQHSKTPPLSDDVGVVAAAIPSPIALPIPTIDGKLAEQQAERQIHDAIKTQVAADGSGASSIDIRPSSEGLIVSLHEAGFFNSGSAELRPESLQVLRALAASLPHQSMRVEGHTDDRPIHTPQFATNWELSTARAANITRLLISENAVDPTQISASGLAEFHPISSNSSPGGRAKNRRVDIVLLNPGSNAPSSVGQMTSTTGDANAKKPRTSYLLYPAPSR